MSGECGGYRKRGEKRGDYHAGGSAVLHLQSAEGDGKVHGVKTALSNHRF